MPCFLSYSIDIFRVGSVGGSSQEGNISQRELISIYYIYKDMNKLIKLTVASIFAWVLILPVALQAKRVELDKAEKLAKHFIESKHGSKTKAKIHLKHASKKQYYVFSINENKDSGFVIVAGDDAVKPVLGYSDNGNYDENNLPPNFAYWMEYLEQQIAWAQEQGLEQSEAVQQEWNAVSPLIQTKWNQTAPYNNMLPDVSGKRSVTGCVATAMAQIMKYYNYPAQIIKSIPSYTTTTNKIIIPSINVGATIYDWQNMQDKYSGGSANTPQNDAVATLMFHVGASVRMDYNPSGSGASATNAVAALRDYFGYDKSIKQEQRSKYKDADWEKILVGQIDLGMPVFYDGYNGTNGHAFVLDGYDNAGRFHFNWGWGGSYDGYFVTTALNPGTGGTGAGSGTYNERQGIIINIKPANVDAPPIIIKHPSNKTVKSGETAQFTVEVEPNGANSLTYQWQVSTTDTIAREDFEGNTHSFTLVNGTQANKWVVGTATAFGGTKSAYISNDSVSNAYTTTSSSIVHIYRDITFPVFETCTLWINVKGIGEANNDYLSIRLAETSTTPVAGTSLTGATTLTGEYGSWTRKGFAINKSTNSGTTKRLVFSWRNNSSGGTNPPIALDDIVIVATTNKPGEGPFKNVTDGTGGTTATYTTPKATEAMNGYRYRCIVRSNYGLPSTSNFATLTIGEQITPTASVLIYNISPATYNGSPQGIGIAAAPGIIGLGAITVKYNGSATVPKDAGTYAITVDIAEGSNYAAATGISLGNYIIDKAEPVYATPANLTATFGDSLSSVALPKGWIWEENRTVGDVGVQIHKASFTPADTANYNIVENIDIPITVNNTTPIHSKQIVTKISVQSTGNAIILQNLPSGAKISVYNLQGKRIYSTTNHSPLATSHLKIDVPAKGMYIVKISIFPYL